MKNVLRVFATLLLNATMLLTCVLLNHVLSDDAFVFLVNFERNQNGKEMYRGTRRTRRTSRSSIGVICTDRTVRCRCQSFAKSLGRSIRQWKSSRIPCMSHSSKRHRDDRDGSVELSHCTGI